MAVKDFCSKIFTSTDSSGNIHNYSWHIHVMSAPMDDLPGISRVWCTIYRTQNLSNSASLTNSAHFWMRPLKGKILTENFFKMRCHDDTSWENKDGRREAWEETKTSDNTGITLIHYYTGSYVASDNYNRAGCHFKPTPQTDEDDYVLYYGTPQYYFEFYIQHEDSGEAEIAFSLEGRISNGYANVSNANIPDDASPTNDRTEKPDMNYNADYVTYTLDTNSEYGAVTPPTSFGYNGNDIMPKNASPITITWSGAGDGKNNPLNKYSVVIFALESPGDDKIVLDWGYVNHNANFTQQSYSFTLDELEQKYYELNGKTINLRGKQITWSVSAFGEITGYDSNSVNSNIGFLVNSLPSYPAVYDDQISPYFPASGGNLTIEGVWGGDADWRAFQRGQLINFFTGEEIVAEQPILCAKVTGGSWEHGDTSEVSLYVPRGTERTQIEVATYDGIEYSESHKFYLERTIASNLTLTSTPIEGAGGIVSAKDSVSQIYTVGANLAISNNLGLEGLTYNFGIAYSVNSPEEDQVLARIILGQNITTPSYKITDIRSQLPNFSTTNNSYYYKYFAYCGTNSEDIVYSSDMYYIPQKPDLIGAYNTDKGENASSPFLKNYFSNTLSFKMTKDGGYNKARLKAGATTFLSSKFTNDSDMLIVFETLDSLPGGTEYTFGLELLKDDQVLYSINTLEEDGEIIKKSRVSSLNLKITSDDPTGGKDGFKIFTDTGNKAFQFYLTNDAHTGPSLSNLSPYGISTLVGRSTLKIGSQSFDIVFPTQYSDEATGRLDFSYISFGSIFDRIKGELNLDGLTTLPTTLFLEDDFGGKLSASTTVVFDCAEHVEGLEGSIGPNSNNSFSHLSYLSEGNQIYLRGKIASYNSSPTAQLQIKRGDDDWINYGSSLALSSQTHTSSPGNPANYTINSQKVGEVLEITRKDYAVQFRLVLSSAGGKDSTYVIPKERGSEDPLELNVLEHWAGRFQLSGISYSSHPTDSTKGIVLVEYQIINPGINLRENSNLTENTLTFEWKIGNQELSQTAQYCMGDEAAEDYQTTPYTNVISREFVIDKVTIDSFIGKIVVKTKSTKGLKTEKTFEIANIKIYNEAPTVSYRRNKIGINTNQVDLWDEAAIVLSATSGDRTKIIVSNPESQIGNYVISIDMLSGEVDGMVFEGGTWD